MSGIVFQSCYFDEYFLIQLRNRRNFLLHFQSVMNTIYKINSSFSIFRTIHLLFFRIGLTVRIRVISVDPLREHMLVAVVDRANGGTPIAKTQV